MPGYEADDALGTLATRAAAAGLPTTIVSGDRDLLQLVNPLVEVFMPRGQDGEVYTPTTVQQRFGVRPDQFVDYKALVGDASDKIPGVPGIGPRTAATLLTQHGTIAALAAAPDTLPPRQASLLETYRERIALNQRLMTIVTVLDLSLDLDACRWRLTSPWTASTLLAALGLRRAASAPLPPVADASAQHAPAGDH